MCRIYEFQSYYVIFTYFQAAVSALFCLSQFCTLKKNQNKDYKILGDSFQRTFQIAFLMRYFKHSQCNFDGGDCCGPCVKKTFCSTCTCLNGGLGMDSILDLDGNC